MPTVYVSLIRAKSARADHPKKIWSSHNCNRKLITSWMPLPSLIPKGSSRNPNFIFCNTLWRTFVDLVRLSYFLQKSLNAIMPSSERAPSSATIIPPVATSATNSAVCIDSSIFLVEAGGGMKLADNGSELGPTFGSFF